MNHDSLSSQQVTFMLVPKIDLPEYLSIELSGLPDCHKITPPALFLFPLKEYIQNNE